MNLICDLLNIKCGGQAELIFPPITCCHSVNCNSEDAGSDSSESVSLGRKVGFYRLLNVDKEDRIHV